MTYRKLGDLPVDATTCTESEDTNRTSEPTGKSLGHSPGPIVHDAEVAVVILCALQDVARWWHSLVVRD